MNLFEALTKVNSTKQKILTIEDIQYYLGCIYEGVSLKANGNYFFIEIKLLNDKFIVQALYNDMCKNFNSWRYSENIGRNIFYDILNKIDVNLYRLQNISRI